MRCKQHPQYQGKSRPKRDCQVCLAIYEMEQQKKRNEVLEAQVSELSDEQKINKNRFVGERIRFGVVSDTHLGSLYENLVGLETAYKIFKDEGIKDVYHCGDLIDGEKMYKGQEYEVRVHGKDAQARYLVDNYPYQRGVTTHFILGNHDLCYWKEVGADVGKNIEEARKDLKYLGREEADVDLSNKKGKVRVRLVHPGGGTAYAISYAPQKYISSLTGGEKPNVILMGHYHKSEYLFYRNVHLFQAGCIQKQTPFMRRKRTPAMTGFWIIDILPDKSGVVRIKQEFIAFY